MHQPNFLPWVGFFHKMMMADVFVVLDKVQVPQGRSWASRTKVKSSKGWEWMTIPLARDGKQSYRDQVLRPAEEWADKIWRTIRWNYGAAPYWNYLEFDKWFEDAAHWSSLADFNSCLIIWAMHALRIRTRLHFQGMEQPKEENPLYLCELYNCPTYLSGQGAKKYNQPDRFKERGIKLAYQEFECPEYPQLWGEFIPNLSILDLIFNCGPDAGDILRDD